MEVAQVERDFGITVPALMALREIETTSRLRADGEKLYMSAPMIVASDSGQWQIAPTGFILLPKTLITVRYFRSTSFDTVASELENCDDLSAGLAFARLLEDSVDRAADTINAVSQHIYCPKEPPLPD